MSRIWLWLATRAASGWIAAAGIAAVLGLGLYIQTLRVDAARCKGRQDAQVLVDKLTDKVVEQIGEKTDEAIHEVNQATDECLDKPVPDSLRDQ